MTNADLFAYHNEIQGWKTSVLYRFLKSRIDNFYNKNQIRLNILIDKLNRLQERYFVMENGVVQTEKNDANKPLVKEGLVYEDYLKEFTDLMNINVEIIF
jgi:hypothetical protein